MDTRIVYAVVKTQFKYLNEIERKRLYFEIRSRMTTTVSVTGEKGTEQ